MFLYFFIFLQFPISYFSSFILIWFFYFAFLAILSLFLCYKWNILKCNIVFSCEKRNVFFTKRCQIARLEKMYYPLRMKNLFYPLRTIISIVKDTIIWYWDQPFLPIIALKALKGDSMRHLTIFFSSSVMFQNKGKRFVSKRCP